MRPDQRVRSTGGAEHRPCIRLASALGRWTLAAAVLSSGTVFLESTVVTVALPALGRDLGLGFDGIQWVVNSYLLTLSALMLLGGSLGDLFGHRSVLAVGLIGFTGSSRSRRSPPTPRSSSPCGCFRVPRAPSWCRIRWHC